MNSDHNDHGELHGLAGILAAQCAVYEKLLTLEADKTEVLLKGDAPALIPLMDAQQALIMQSKGLEKQRSGICDKLPYATLREMIQSDAQSKEVLGPAFEALGAVVEALKKKSALNKKLLETRLSTIRFLTGQMETAASANTYTRNTHAKA